MKPESLVFAAAGALFGLIAAGFSAPSRRRCRPQSVAAPAADSSQPASPRVRPRRRRRSSIRPRSDRLLKVAAADPTSPSPRAALGNLYFDAERYKDATQWYEAALKLDPNNADVSTDLGVGYYYLNQPDRALAQFDQLPADRSEAHQDAAQRRHRPRVRQAGSGGRGASVGAGAGARAGESGRTSRQAGPGRHEGRAPEPAGRLHTGDAGARDQLKGRGMGFLLRVGPLSHPDR